MDGQKPTSRDGFAWHSRSGFMAGAQQTARLLRQSVHTRSPIVRGLNGALWGAGDAASTREAWRLALFSVLAPLGKMVESELKDKLDDDVSLTWTELRASDLSGRARAMQSMVGGGMAVADAVAVAGLMVED